ncbi:glycosyltransferase family 2 protein [Proteobacteria bacterium 005FR1]|nr:glycosyltransferase family 2 protein [Proteobacteria bacterium 005FR1]
MKLTAVILTLNEEQHLPRCLSSLEGVVTDIVVVDCFSADATIEIARSAGARVIQRQWTNHARQFNWGLSQLAADTDWVLRIDADEYLTPELAAEIKENIVGVDQVVNGIYCGRRMTFQGRLIRHGGVFPIRVLRLFRFGRGECENRWMDEHIKVEGATADFSGEIIDDNLNSLTWWTDKHNKYASREAVDLLNLEYGFMPHDSIASLQSGNRTGLKRWVKERVYARLPGGFRAFAYFFYRYVFRVGFLDGQAGTAFHFLQGFWYRYLVDAKVTEVKRFMRDQQVSVIEAIETILGIEVTITNATRETQEQEFTSTANQSHSRISS